MDARPDFLAVDRDGDAAPKGEVPVREAGEQRHAGERREDGLERSGARDGRGLRGACMPWVGARGLHGGRTGGLRARVGAARRGKAGSRPLTRRSRAGRRARAGRHGGPRRRDAAGLGGVAALVVCLHASLLFGQLGIGLFLQLGQGGAFGQPDVIHIDQISQVLIGGNELR